MSRKLIDRAGLAAAGLALLLCVGFLGCGGPGADQGAGKPPGASDYLSLTFDVLGAFPVPDPTGDLPGSGFSQAAAGAKPAGPSSGSSAAGRTPTGSQAPGTEASAADRAPAAGAAASLVPPEIRSLNGREVAILGYMVPVDYEAEGTNRFVLLKCTLACCYGKLPRVNEWIDVTMNEGRRVPYYENEPVWVFGRLEVNEEIEGGNLVGLYWLHAEKTVKPKAS